MIESKCKIIENKQIARDTYEMTLETPAVLESVPGQFINVKLREHFLRRPISISSHDEDRIIIVYKVVGVGTRDLAARTHGTVEILYPLGNGYNLGSIPDAPVLVGGGVGIPPLYGLAKALTGRGKKPDVILGFGTGEEVFYEEKFRALGLDVKITTLDGTAGKKGVVTDVLDPGRYVCACGPEGMLKAVDRLSSGGQYSFEERMACGFGACMGCSCQTKYGNKRICKDGPVLRKEEILW
ncbi:MAG: dihydroorotate dehydrogenase electron transfer subunit [Anaerovoracaceae bacterium]|jgi:dihydroorotate dehydrogenase electron transfer subunit